MCPLLVPTAYLLSPERNWGGWHAFSVFFFSLQAVSSPESSVEPLPVLRSGKPKVHN